MNVADQELDREQKVVQQPADEQPKSRLPVKRLRPWFGIALLSGVAAATAAVWVSATRSAPTNSTNDAVRNERPDESWLNHEPDRFAKAGSTPTPAPVATPTQPMTLPSYQPPQSFQAPPPANPDADYQRQEYRRALASDLIVTAPGQPPAGQQVLETPRLLSPQADGQRAASATDTTPLAVSPQPASPYTISAGTVIYGTLETGINSDLPGNVLGRVAQDVKDSVTQTYVLIPQGSKLIGTYDRGYLTPQQDRLFVAWREIVFPNGGEIQLPDLPGTDQAGYAGFQDQVNHHYVKVWAPALLMSAISAGMMMSQAPIYAGGAYGGFYTSPGQMAAMGAGQELGQVAMSHVGNATVETKPTIQIRPGYNFRVMVTRDLVFAGPYHE
jgi:type IV secretory pathway VirB10-like protein